MNSYSVGGNTTLGGIINNGIANNGESNKPSLSNMVSGGMPCKFQLLMEFFCSFLFTFIIYFCVFAFFPYDGIINGENGFFLSDTRMYFNEKFVNTKAKFSEIWEKFKDKIIPALIISFIYYIIWLIFFKLIPIILKYLINVAQQFK